MEELPALVADVIESSWGDEVAYTSLGVDDLLLSELLVGVDDRIGGDLHQYGHIPYGGDASLFYEAPREDALADIVDDVGKSHVR